MSGIELSRVRTELRLLPHEPINQSLLVSRGPALLCNQVDLAEIHFTGNGCRLRRSMQHLHEVYSPESENLKSVWGVDSSAVRPD